MEAHKDPDFRFRTPDFTPPADPDAPAQHCTDRTDGNLPEEPIRDLFPSATPDIDDCPKADDAGIDCEIIITPPLDDSTADTINAKLDALMQKFDDRLARDAHKDALFDKMYDELASYKNDIYAKLLKPFILSAISLLDDTNSFISRLDADGTGTPDPDKMRRFIGNLPLDIEELLESNGVEIYTDPSDTFNPATQRVVKTIPTTCSDSDKLIAERHRKGYRWNGVVLRPEMVSIYKYKQ